MNAPNAIRPLVAFPSFLRSRGFAASPDQTIGFLEAVGLLGPRGMDDIRRAAIALFAIPKDRETEFEELFRAFFLDQAVAAPARTESDENDTEVREDRGGDIDVAQPEDPEPSGWTATAEERLGQRRFSARDESEGLDLFTKAAAERLPRRKSRRYEPAARGEVFNMRKTLREMIRHGGETTVLAARKRKYRQRRIVLLIDVSGSMKERTASILRFAHALASVADHLEVFTLGTRLTRITSALSIRDRERALARVAALVADFDGGTRIGEALQAFLNIPRYAGFARGAAVVVLSDGLERGTADLMAHAARQLSRWAWRLFWLTPLAADRDYIPETDALSRTLPYLDDLGDGSRIEAIANHFLNMARQ